MAERAKMEDRYIVLKVVGDYTRQIAMKHNVEAHAMGKELGINRYLADMTESRNAETVTENYTFAYEDMTNTPGIDRRARVALLVSPGDRSHDFVETVATNSGLNVKIFTDRNRFRISLPDTWEKIMDGHHRNH